MQQIKIETVDTQSLQATLASRHGAPPAGVVRINLADQKDLIATPPNRLANQPFGSAVAVHLGGIDQVHAQFDTALQGGDFLGAPGSVVADHPRPHPKCRDRCFCDVNLFHRVTVDE